MVAIRLARHDGKVVAHGHGGQGDDWHIHERPVENNQEVVGAGEAGGLLEMPYRCQDQGFRGYQSTDRQPRTALKTAASIVSGEGGLLERQIAIREAVCLVHQVVLPGARRHVSQAVDRVLLQGSQRD